MESKLILPEEYEIAQQENASAASRDSSAPLRQQIL